MCTCRIPKPLRGASLIMREICTIKYFLCASRSISRYIYRYRDRDREIPRSVTQLPEKLSRSRISIDLTRHQLQGHDTWFTHTVTVHLFVQHSLTSQQKRGTRNISATHVTFRTCLGGGTFFTTVGCTCSLHPSKHVCCVLLSSCCFIGN
jgi:hypothetical protein